ncbi:MAG: TonB-dependent receptor [Terracidiphilus sp.]|nr:TonB-dependent receptor [Terracidiphilus sp.]
MKRSSFPGEMRKSSPQLFCVLVLACLMAMPAMVFGQSYFGTVTGVLTDPTGAVIPGVKVTLTDQEKGYAFNSISDGAGRYLYRSIPPGIYSVTAEMQGFEKTVHTGVRVDVNQNATANLSLKVSGATQTVEVTAQGQVLDAQDATTGLVVDRKFINDLPLIDRNVMDLTMLTPGVTEADDQCVGCGGTNFVSNGSRNATADVLMDGATLTNYEPNGGVTQMTYTPSSEAVDELRVEQSNFSAEYGFSGASVVNMITRSGSNAFHGSGYDFVRNKIADSNNWFNNLNGNPLPSVHRHNFGGTAGGPIFKNRTFFFFDYDGTRASNLGTYQAGVPSDAERNDGDFGEVCTAQGGAFDNTGMCTVAAGQIWDPYTGIYVANEQGAGAVRSAFIPYNKVGAYASPGNPKLAGTPYQLPGGPGNLIDPVAQGMMKLFPEPSATMANPTIYDNWSASGASRSPNDQYDIKIDHRFSPKNLLSGKYSREWNTNVSYNCFGNFADPCAGGPNWGGAHLLTLNDTHTFTSTLLLTAVLGFTRAAMRISAYNGDGGVTDPLAKLGFPEYLNSNAIMGVPSMFIGSSYYSAGYTSIGGDPYGNYKQGQDAGQLTVALNKVHGGHEMKFGFEGRQHQQNYIQTNAPNGTFGFDRSGTSACPYDFATCGGDGMASFMMGQTNGIGYEIQDQPATEDHQYAWYAQDNWKVNHKLTLNLGLRYDISMPRTDRHNRQNWLDLSVQSPLQVAGFKTMYGGEVFASPSQRTIVNGDWKDIQPRFGFAYQLTPLTVVRGGYGIYYSQPRSGVTGVAPYGSQGFNQYTSAVTTYQSDGATPYLHLSNPFPDLNNPGSTGTNGLIQPPGNKLGLMNDIGYGANGPLRDVTNTPYEQSWSFGLERQLPANVLVSAIYAGKKGTHLYYSGANYINHLGPEIEGYSLAQINDLTNLVDNPFASAITDAGSYLSAPQVQALFLQLPYPQFPNGVTIDAPPIANSTYHSLQLTAEKRYSNGLQFLASYVWSKSIDDASVPDDNTTWLGSFTSLVDPNKPWLERSLSTFDIPNVFQFSYTYDLPLGRGKRFLNKMPRVLDEFVGGWKTNGVWRVAGGRPLPFFTYDGTSLPTYGGQRPNIVGRVRRHREAPDSVWINSYFANPEAVRLPPVYTFGNAPRATGMIRSPEAFNTNMSMEKEFSLSRLHEGMNFELRLEAENALNHPVFGTPDTSVDDPNFGVVGYTSNGPRQVQLGGKITF